MKRLTPAPDWKPTARGRRSARDRGTDLNEYDPFQTETPTMRCPSDTEQSPIGVGMNNYGFCHGDAILRVGYNPSSQWVDQGALRGLFQREDPRRFAAVKDGLSNTIAMGEIVTDQGDRHKSGTVVHRDNFSGPAMGDGPALCETALDPERPQFIDRSFNIWQSANTSRGGRWWNAHLMISGINTVLPPNSPTCPIDWGTGWQSGVFSAGSLHPGGAHVLLCDGAVQFVTDSIEAGDKYAQSISKNFNNIGAESPYGLWGALGTIESKEVIEESLNQ